MMLVIMVAGMVLRKLEIIRGQDKRVLVDLSVNIILPCNIIAAFCVEFNQEILQQGATIMLISMGIQLFCVVLSKVLYNRFPKEQKMILQYGTICSNAGYLGNPVAEGLYGPMGLLYASIYLIPQRIVMWSVGVTYFAEVPDKRALAKKVVTHPCIVAVMIGVVLMISQIQLPTFLFQSIDRIGSCTTAVTMLLIGATLQETKNSKMLTKTTAFFSFLRLGMIPAIVFLVCKFAHVPEMIGGLAVVLAAMPAGTTTAVLAVKYKADEKFATQCVVLTTVLSLLSIPIWCMIIMQWY